jgi:hypothetical protein
MKLLAPAYHRQTQGEASGKWSCDCSVGFLLRGVSSRLGRKGVFHDE